ncbi:elongation factor G-like protein EF-G2 [Aestuariimicrobium ganziense]|uniref:elongation factor G-like protein EF-G2 n=1 Tax=Aestuariimicrobium ganziense TaxID=2773677 RepID=UPI0019442E74|nr:elongation factor G-like protein EF-G2 [Aestuariimicrobium ganziense]
MSSKANNQAVSVPADLRNVVLVGSAGSGKSTLFEHLLRARIAGYRPDKDDSERAAALTLASVATGDVVVNLLDAPGHPDFVGELRAGLRAADAAIFVVSATDGIDNATAALWRECAAVNMPRAIVVTKLDAERGDFEAAVEACQEAFGANVVPAYLPLRRGSEIIGNISLTTKNVHDYSSGSDQPREATDEESALIEEYRAQFLESGVTEADDEELMERYLEGEDLAVSEVAQVLLGAIAQANFFPVIPVLSTNGVGTEELYSLIERGFPTPDLHELPQIGTPQGEPLDPMTADPDGELVAEVIRTTSDPFAGRLSMVRVFSGTLRTDDVVHVSGHRQLFSGVEDTAHPDHDGEERVGALSFPVGTELKQRPQAIAGDIVLVARLSQAETSDTISSRERPAVIEPWVLPQPQLPMAVRAQTRKDEDKMPNALARLVVEDTTVRLERNAETDQLVLWTMGQAHTDLLLARLNERYGVSVDIEDVRVGYRETLTASFNGQGRHVKQSGGHGQYAVCEVTYEPNERGAGFEFIDKVVGGVVPRQFIPSVEKGIRAQLEKGTVYGYPMVDVKATLFDGKAHSVDSSDMAFQTAGSLSLKDNAKPHQVALLEPVDDVTVTVGEEYLGVVMTDLSNRRGRVLGTDAGGPHEVVIRAQVPASELSRYAIDLRGLAHGSGSFTRTFSGYEQAPESVIKALPER